MGMPWHQTHPVNERVKFVAAAQSGRRTMTELCASFGVSRKSSSSDTSCTESTAFAIDRVPP
jgi:hypothetical protein